MTNSAKRCAPAMTQRCARSSKLNFNPFPMEPNTPTNQAASTPPAGRPTPTAAELRAAQARNRRRTRGAFGRRPTPRKA